jgi:hypothetical protein
VDRPPSFSITLYAESALDDAERRRADRDPPPGATGRQRRRHAALLRGLTPGNNHDLYSIDPSTSISRLVGDTGFSPLYNGLFVNGVLYGFVPSIDVIVTINISTARSMLVSVLAIDARGA